MEVKTARHNSLNVFVGKQYLMSDQGSNIPSLQSYHTKSQSQLPPLKLLEASQISQISSQTPTNAKKQKNQENQNKIVPDKQQQSTQEIGSKQTYNEMSPLKKGKDSRNMLANWLVDSSSTLTYDQIKQASNSSPILIPVNKNKRENDQQNIDFELTREKTPVKMRTSQSQIFQAQALYQSQNKSQNVSSKFIPASPLHRDSKQMFTPLNEKKIYSEIIQKQENPLLRQVSLRESNQQFSSSPSPIVQKVIEKQFNQKISTFQTGSFNLNSNDFSSALKQRYNTKQIDSLDQITPSITQQQIENQSMLPNINQQQNKGNQQRDSIKKWVEKTQNQNENSILQQYNNIATQKYLVDKSTSPVLAPTFVESPIHKPRSKSELPLIKSGFKPSKIGDLSPLKPRKKEEMVDFFEELKKNDPRKAEKKKSVLITKNKQEESLIESENKENILKISLNKIKVEKLKSFTDADHSPHPNKAKDKKITVEDEGWALINKQYANSSSDEEQEKVSKGKEKYQNSSEYDEEKEQLHDAWNFDSPKLELKKKNSSKEQGKKKGILKLNTPSDSITTARDGDKKLHKFRKLKSFSDATELSKKKSVNFKENADTFHYSESSLTSQKVRTSIEPINS